MSVVEPSPDFWARKRVCVTGGTGFLGYHIVQQLVTLGARVRVLALPPNPEHPLLKASNVEFMRGDVRDLAVVRGAVAACDVIFQTAGVVAVWGQALQRMNSVHVEGTRNVLAAAAILYGLAASDLRPDELAAHDPAYEVTIGIRAIRT